MPVLLAACTAFLLLIAAPAAAQEPAQRPWWEDDGEQLSRIEYGLLFDFFLAFSEKKDSDDAFNEMRVRGAQLHLRAPVDETARLYATMDFADAGDGSEWVLREAAARIDDLPIPFWPDNFHLLIGQYYADLGAWNGVLANEFPAPQLDGVRRAFLGGNLAARGIEAHHLIPMRAWTLRWSAGLAGELEGQDVDFNDLNPTPVAQPDAFGRYGFRNWAAHGRVEGQWELGDGLGLRAGVSALGVPNEVQFTDTPTGVVRDETNHLLAGLDLGLRWEPTPGQVHEVSAELWRDENEYRSGTPTQLVDEQERGEWAMYELTFDDRWSAGAMLSRFDQLGLGPDRDAHYHSVWGTHRFSAVNEVTLFLTHTNPGPAEQKWYTFGAQWVLSIGARRDTGHRRWL